MLWGNTLRGRHINHSQATALQWLVAHGSGLPRAVALPLAAFHFHEPRCFMDCDSRDDW